MTHWLSDHICAAIRARDLLLLDTRDGQYGCVPGGGAGLEIAPEGRVTARDMALAAELTRIGLIRPGPGPPRQPLPDPPIGDLGLALRAPAGPSGVLTMSGATLDMVRAYWRPAFPDLVRRARARQAVGLRPGSEGELRRHALQFRDLLPWIPFQGQCLFRSVMLQLYLRRRGLASALVFGCQAWPFEAHCWVQAGGLVLDDGVDHVLGFTPLLAIGG